MLLRTLGLLDLALGVACFFGLSVYTSLYLLVKGILALTFLSRTCVLNWCDLIFGALLLFSPQIFWIVGIYLVMKGFLSLV